LLADRHASRPTDGINPPFRQAAIGLEKGRSSLRPFSFSKTEPFHIGLDGGV